MFIQRDSQRTEKDDFVLNVVSYVGKYSGAIKQYGENGEIIGWIIKPIYE